MRLKMKAQINNLLKKAKNTGGKASEESEESGEIYSNIIYDGTFGYGLWSK